MNSSGHPVIGIVGLGQIGGSIALELLGKTSVRVFARSPEARRAGAEVGLEVCGTLAELAGHSDIIFVAVPVDQTAIVIGELIEHLKPGQIVTDVGSTKAELVDWSRSAAWLPGVEFIGGHPMAGTDVSGFSGAKRGLFRNRTWMLTPEDGHGSSGTDALIALMTVITDQLGARIVITDSKTHDRAVAVVSHLEHLVALALVNLLRNSDDESLISRLVAGSFMDATRVSKSAGSMVVPFLVGNPYLPEVEALFIDEMMRLSGLLNKLDALGGIWEEGSQWRSRLEALEPESEFVSLATGADLVNALIDISKQGKFVKSLQRHLDGIEVEVG